MAQLMAGFFLIEGETHPAAMDRGGAPPDAIVAADGDHVWVHLDGRIVELVWQDALSHFAAEDTGGDGDLVRAPMPGVAVSISVAAGEQVRRGDAIMVIESMKLETVIRAPRDGVIETVAFVVGQSFEREAVLVTLVGEAA